MSDLDVLSAVKKCTECRHFRDNDLVCDYHGFVLKNADSVFCERYNERDCNNGLKKSAIDILHNELQGCLKSYTYDDAVEIFELFAGGKIPHVKIEF